MVVKKMKQYIGTNIVDARPMTGDEFVSYIEKQPQKSNNMLEVGEGYLVKYADGYESWSPKDAFDEAYRESKGMPFGLAIEALKKGLKVARKGWNGKSQYIELATGIGYINAGGISVNAAHKDIGNKAIAFVGTRGTQLGWLASQADMLADDWYIVE